MKIQDKSFYSTIHKPQTNFKATVHILDNGTHANGLCNFAKAVFKNNHIIDNLQLHRVRRVDFSLPNILNWLTKVNPTFECKF